MTTEHAPIFDDAKAKKRAYGLRARAEELGYKLSMGHTYELLASAHGYRDWATMKPVAVTVNQCDDEADNKPAMSRTRGERSLSLCQMTRINSDDQVANGEAVRIPFSAIKEHFEVISGDDRARANFIARISQSTIIEDLGSTTFIHAGRDQVEFLKRTAKQSNANLVVIDLDGEFRRRGEDMELFRELDASELALYLFGHVKFEPSYPTDAPRWNNRFSILTKALAKVLVWLRDEKDAELNQTMILNYLSLKVIIDLCTSALHHDIPADVVEPLRRYCECLPGFDLEKRHNQFRGPFDQHGYMELLLARAFNEFPDLLHNACSPSNVNFKQAINDDCKIVVVLPERNKMTRAQWATVQTILSVVSRLVAKRSDKKLPYVISLDHADRYTLIDFQTILVSATEANCGYVIASKHGVSVPKLKASPTIRIGKAEGNRYSAQMVTMNEVGSFQITEIENGS